MILGYLWLLFLPKILLQLWLSRLWNDYLSFSSRFSFSLLTICHIIIVSKKKIVCYTFLLDFFFFFCFFCTYTMKQIYEKMKMLTAYLYDLPIYQTFMVSSELIGPGFFFFYFILSSLSRNRPLRECGKNRLSSLELLYGPFNQLKEFSVWTRQIHIQDKD